MSLSVHGNSTFAVEVTHISSHGIWVLTHDKELFLSYDDFPWFKDQPVKSIFKVEEKARGHFYWPDMDIDLTIESTEHPDGFPLKSKVQNKAHPAKAKKQGTDWLRDCLFLGRLYHAVPYLQTATSCQSDSENCVARGHSSH